MQARRRMVGKSPAIPIPIPRPPAFTAIPPTTILNSSCSFMSHAGVAGNGYVSPETKLDLNVPLPLADVEELSPPRSRYSVSSCAKKSAPIPTLAQALEKEIKDGSKTDLRKLRRTVSNRLSAQRSRMKKAQFIVEMEQKVKDLQDTISILNPQIENYKAKQRALRIQKAGLEEQLQNCITNANLCCIQIEENRREVQRLRELQKVQKEQMMLASNFGSWQQPPSLNVYALHRPQLQLGSSFHQHYEEPDTMSTDPAVVDQYINFDALN